MSDKMTDVEQDKMYDGFMDQLSHAHLAFAMLPLLLKIEPRMRARLKTKIQSFRELEKDLLKLIDAIENGDAIKKPTEA